MFDPTLARELALPVDERVPIDCRLAVNFSIEVWSDTIDSLLSFLEDDERPLRISLDSIGWDFFRIFGGVEWGFDPFRRLRWTAGRRQADGLEASVYMPSDEVIETHFLTFDRERRPDDRLIIDEMDEAEAYGWEAPPDIKRVIEWLREVADIRKEPRKVERETSLWVVHFGELREWANDTFEMAREIPLTQDLPTSPYWETFWKECREIKKYFREDQIAERAIAWQQVKQNFRINSAKYLKRGPIKPEDFWATPGHVYIFTPTGEAWPAATVDSRLGQIRQDMVLKPIRASTWLDRNRAVEQITWAPGESQIIEGRLIRDGGWIETPCFRTFNLYKPPTIEPIAGDPQLWIRHFFDLYGGQAPHMIRWLAFKVQRPQDKINSALVMGGPQGVGKDTLLEPIKHAIGPWNFQEVSPTQMLGRFNGFLKSVIMRVSEARDLGELNRYAFYEHLKPIIAAPPDVLRVDEKNMREHAVLNVVGVILTTNRKTDGIYLPPDDRRHYVGWTARTKEEFSKEYWNEFWGWYANGGLAIVADYLRRLDLTDFDPKAPPPKTRAFWEIVDASRAPEDAEMADALDRLGRPQAVTLSMIMVRVEPGFSDWLRDRKNRRKIPHRFEECGYVPVRNLDASDGLWKINGARQAVYALRELSIRDQLTAADTLTRGPTP